MKTLNEQLRDIREANGMGRGGGPLAAGPGGSCVCPECGHKETHEVGTPCMEKSCSECGAKMTRATSKD